MLNQDKPGPQPGQNEELLGIMECNCNGVTEITKFFKVRGDNGYSIKILQTNPKNIYDVITIEEEHFNDFADALVNVLQSIENELNNEQQEQ